MRSEWEDVKETTMTDPNSPFIYIDPKAGADRVFVLESGNDRRLPNRPVSVHWYQQDVDVNISKNLIFPRLRGTWLPSFDMQTVGFGMAMNWLGIRVRIDLMG